MRINKHQFINLKTILTVVFLVMVVVIIIYSIRGQDTFKPSDDTTRQPAFATIEPINTSIESLGGWTRISPPENDPVFAYTDTINNVPITVSEQPLPESFKSDIPSGVANLANNFNATTKLNAKSTDFYIGTSATGPQSVIFVKNSVLVLIKSQKKIDDTSWSAYIESLQSK